MDEIKIGKNIRIYGVIYKDIMRTKKLSGTSKLIYCYLLSFSGGSDRVFPGISKMCEELGVSKPTVINHRKELEKIGLLTVEKEITNKGSKNIYYLHDIDFREDKQSSSSDAVDYEIKKQDKIPYREIVEYLNEQTGKNFNYKSKANKKFISARYNEGNTLDDFKHVIDVKVADWLNEEAMKTYLKPETLFNGKNFEKYKNETVEEINERKKHWNKQKKQTLNDNFNDFLNSID